MIKQVMTLSALLTTAAALPGTSRAITPDAVAAQCFKAFETRLSEKFSPAPKVQDTRVIGQNAFSPADYISGSEYMMVATNPRNHAEVLRASCVVTDGRVVSLTELQPGVQL